MADKRPYNRINLRLTQGDIRRINNLLYARWHTTRIRKRLIILRALHDGLTAAHVARIAGVSPTTVRTIARRYMDHGLGDILNPIR